MRVSVAEYKQMLGKQKDRSINKKNFAQKAEQFGYKVTPEFKFAPDRKFRADWKVLKNSKSVLVEYEGLICKKSGHLTIDGFSKNCEKYNLAQIMGYPVLRYTVTNFCNVFEDLSKILEQEGVIGV